jgi:hypothetical protein
MHFLWCSKVCCCIYDMKFCLCPNISHPTTFLSLKGRFPICFTHHWCLYSLIIVNLTSAETCFSGKMCWTDNCCSNSWTKRSMDIISGIFQFGLHCLDHLGILESWRYLSNLRFLETLCSYLTSNTGYSYCV